MAKNAVITGWGFYVPSRIMTNADLERIVDTSDEWIATRTGIRERDDVVHVHACGPDGPGARAAQTAGRAADRRGHVLAGLRLSGNRVRRAERSRCDQGRSVRYRGRV